jgi:hypothetical protein
MRTAIAIKSGAIMLLSGGFLVGFSVSELILHSLQDRSIVGPIISLTGGLWGSIGGVYVCRSVLRNLQDSAPADSVNEEAA